MMLFFLKQIARNPLIYFQEGEGPALSRLSESNESCVAKNGCTGLSIESNHGYTSWALLLNPPYCSPNQPSKGQHFGFLDRV